MGKLEDRKNVVQIIQRAANAYKRNLVGRRFLYVFDGRFIEVLYKADNFRHLTGVDTTLSARRFYQYAVSGKLSASQIFFSHTHPYDLCIKKLKHIEQIAGLAGTECFMLEEIRTSTTMYKFGTTNLNFSLCLNKEYDESGNEKSECYIVQSLRDEDCFSKSKGVYTVTHILSRANDEKKYNTALYAETDLKALPEFIRTMICERLL